MKYFKYLFLIIFLLGIPNVSASTQTFTRTEENLLVPDDVVVDDSNREMILKTPAVDSSEKIYDFVDLFSTKQETYLYQQLDKYLAYSNFEAIIVTVKDLGEVSVEETAKAFYNYNSFADNGIILLLYRENSSIKTYVGRMGVEGNEIFDIYTDSNVRQILNVVNEAVEKKDYYKAGSDYIQTLYGFYNARQNGDYREGEDGTFKGRVWIEIGVISFSITFIVMALFIRKVMNNNHLKYKDDLENKINNSTSILEKEEENYIDSVLAK